ncbi:unnamed protein product [Paramecium octaurelia]|uniref:Uncharacterized protein n=1 Tax=Paramecium octaurelia TaxID=43137 RepID=A0A8S1YK97_PAROT|nr:unnamed protein product [Paramecium octaurelia]
MTIKNLIVIELKIIKEDAEAEEQQSECEKLQYNPYLIIRQGNTCSFKNKIIQEYYFAHFLKRILINERMINVISNSELQQINLTDRRTFENLRKSRKNQLKSQKCLKILNIRGFLLIPVFDIFPEFQSWGRGSFKYLIIRYKFSGISFFNCNLSGSVFKNAIINRCNFDFAKLNNVNWSTIQIAEIANLQQKEKVEYVVFTPDGSYLISLQAIVLKKWDCRPYELMNQVNQDKTDRSFQIFSNIEYSFREQQIIQIFSRDFKTLNDILYKIQIRFEIANALQFSPDTETVGLIDSDGWVRYWKSDGQSLQTKSLEQKILYYVPPTLYTKLTIEHLMKVIVTSQLDIISRIDPIESIEEDLFNASQSGKKFEIVNKEDVIFYTWHVPKLTETERINFRYQILQFITLTQNWELAYKIRKIQCYGILKTVVLKEYLKAIRQPNVVILILK